MYTVNIHISGYDPTNLERANFWLMKLAQKCKGEDINGWPLPKRRHLITVLRSPHVNKKSREQFFETTRGRMFVGQTHLPGVELSMKVLQPTVFPNFYCIYIK